MTRIRNGAGRAAIAALITLLGAPGVAAQQPGARDTAAAPENPRQQGLPLVPTRKLQYTAQQGSWVSLDVSPDGQRIVFDLLGDLYLMPFAGGPATPLTRGMGFDMQPRFSPDGRRVVFVSDRGGGWGVWIVSLDGRDTVQVTRGKNDGYQSPEWTPDGSYIVVSRDADGPGRLHLFHADGGAGVSLIRRPDNLRTTGPAFGPDGRYIWYARRTGTWTYNAPMSEWQLAVYDRETGEQAQRTFRYGGAVRPTLSPDGRWLVYGTRHIDETALRIRDLQNGDERWLAYPVQRDAQEDAATRDVLPGMSFTPDSRELVVSYGGRLWRVPVAGGPPLEIPFQAEVDLDLGPAVDFDYPIQDSATFVARQIRDATPSPDGTRLAFTALDRLYVMEYPGGVPRRLTSADLAEAEPTWSPDGQWIAYVTATTEDGGHLMKVRADGRTRPQQLTTLAALYRQPAWAPDGRRVVAVRGAARAFVEATQRNVPGGAQDLVWIPADGGPATLIVPVDDFADPHFTRDTSRIYASRDGGMLISFRWDGTDRKLHLRVNGPRLPNATQPVRASQIRIAPGGDRAIAQVVNELYVVTVPYAGVDTPTVAVADPDGAAFPARRLTVVGGQFPAWRADGRVVHWSAGNAHFTYDLDRARAVEDSVRRATAGESPSGGQERAAGSRRRQERPAYQAQESRIRIEVPRDIPQGTVVLRGVRAVTMRGEEVIDRADIVVRNNRIAAVGPQGGVTVPAGARIMDLAGTTVLPGFVDTHAHLRAAADIHKTDNWAYLANLAYGVTTARDPQTATTDVLTYEDLADAGQIMAPRMFSTGPGVFNGENLRDREHARDVLRRYADYYGITTIKMYLAGNREQRQWVIDAARDLRLMPTTEGALDYAMDLTMAVDGYSGQEHNTPGFPFYEDVVKLYVAAGTAYTPTVIVTYGGPWAENYYFAAESPFDDEKLRRFTPWEDFQSKVLRRNAGWFHPRVHTMDRVARLAADIVKAGGVAGVGSHGQLQGLGYHWELWSMQAGGLSNHQALRVATALGAQAIGRDRDLGSLESGKLADLVVLDRNPLENIRHTNSVRFVMKNGRLYDGNTLDEVHPRQRKAGPYHWQRGVHPTPAAGER
ncbi:MAG TPA: amidohydrolase family protein [Gemmatimonadales bacterium]|nr:amidohydrolase family protein [Gemmatimonadales bacterium]